jgi:hypothetical protein
MSIDDIIRSAISRAGVVRVRSALNPFLWCFVWTVAFLVATYFLRDDAVTKYACLWLAALPLLITLSVGILFALKDPDRLQSEEFVIKQSELRMIYKKGASAEIVEVAREVPLAESLPHGFGDGGGS